MFHSHWSVSVVLVHKSLEGVEITSIVGDESARISSWMVHTRHLLPLMIKDIKLLTVCNHDILIVTASDNVDEPILEVIMSGEARPAQ